MVRLVLSAIRERLGETALLGLLAALVVAVGVAGPLYADAAARNVVAATADTATPAELSLTVTVEMTSRNGFAAALAELRGSIATAPAGPGVREIRGGYRRGAVTPREPGAPVELLLAARDDACAHLALTGACPTAPGEAALAATTAARLGLAVGDTFGFQVRPSTPAAPLRVTGVYAVDGASATLTDPYWAGRAELTPVPLRAENPVFTVPESLQALDADTFQATLDYVADLTAMSPADVDTLARTLRDGDVPGRGIAVTGGLSRLLPQIVADRDTVAVPVVTGAVLLLGVAWWVLLLGVGHAAAARRTQTVLGALRGAPARHRAALTAGPGVLTVLLALPVGLVLGRLLAQLLAWAAMDAAGPVELTATALAVAVGLTLAVLASVVVTYVRAQRGGVLDALRQVPARRGAAGNVAVVVVVVLAVAAAVQLRNGDEVLGLAGYVLPAAAPVLMLVAAGLVAARAVRPLAGLLGRAGLRSGRAGTALAALYAARRPGMDRLVALVVIVMALLAHAAYGWQGLQADEAERARLALGAAEVVRVRAPSRAALLHQVRQADPAGAWAMAVARQESSSGTTVAVDTSRLARVAYWPATADVTADQLTRALRPPANPAVRVTGATLLLDLTAPATVEVDQPLTAVLDGPDGAPVTATSAVVPGRGRQTLRLAVPACASGDGCRLAWLSFRYDPGGLVLHGIAQAGPDAVVADAAAMTDPARWRTTVGAEGRVSLTPLPAGLAVDYEPADPRFPDPEVRVQVADVPLPMPAVLAGQARLAHDRTVLRGEMLSPLRRPVDVLAAVPALPGVGAQGLLVDLEYADRVGDSTDNIADLQVWLSPDAPADALDRLRDTGLVPVSAQTAVQRAEHGLAVGLGPGSRFRFGAALLAVLLVMVAVALVVAVDAPRRGAELAALRTQGLPQRAVGRATRSGYVLIVAAAAAGGGLLGAAVADGSAASTLPVAVLTVATLLLAVTAFTVGTRLSKVTGLDLEEGR